MCSQVFVCPSGGHGNPPEADPHILETDPPWKEHGIRHEVTLYPSQVLTSSVGYWSGWYASYWNAYLSDYVYCFLCWCFFKKKYLGDINPFCEATNTPVLDFWFSKSKWTALFVLSRGLHVTHFLRFTSGATPADLLVVILFHIHGSRH